MRPIKIPRTKRASERDPTIDTSSGNKKNPTVKLPPKLPGFRELARSPRYAQRIIDNRLAHISPVVAPDMRGIAPHIERKKRPYKESSMDTTPRFVPLTPSRPYSASRLYSRPTVPSFRMPQASSCPPAVVRPHWSSVKSISQTILGVDEFEVLGRIGTGSYGDVYKVQSSDGKKYAVKKTRRHFRGMKHRKEALGELRALTEIRSSPFCIEYFKSWEHDGSLCILLELCDRGTLEEYLISRELSENTIWAFSADLALGVSHIHSRGIVHLDLKPANIFLSSNGKLKIGDFGIAMKVPSVRRMNLKTDETKTYSHSSSSLVKLTGEEKKNNPDTQGIQLRDNKTTKHKLKHTSSIRQQSKKARHESHQAKFIPLQRSETRDGDPVYMAPEALDSSLGALSFPADIFSLGVILLEMAADVKLPSHGEEWQKLRLEQFQCLDSRGGGWTSRSSPLKTLIQVMMRRLPCKRPSANDVCFSKTLKQYIETTKRSAVREKLDLPRVSPMVPLFKSKDHVGSIINRTASDFDRHHRTVSLPTEMDLCSPNKISNDKEQKEIVSEISIGGEGARNLLSEFSRNESD